MLDNGYLESRRLARSKLDKAFTKKFNPIDDVLEKLDEIDKQSRADAAKKEALAADASKSAAERQLDRDRLNEDIRSNKAEGKRIADKDRMAAEDRDAMLEEKKAEAAKVKAADQLKLDAANRSEAVSSARALKPMIDANAKITPDDVKEAMAMIDKGTPAARVERAPGVKEVMSPTGDLVAKGKFSGSNELFQAVEDLNKKMSATEEMEAAKLKSEKEKAEALARSKHPGAPKAVDPNVAMKRELDLANAQIRNELLKRQAAGLPEMKPSEKQAMAEIATLGRSADELEKFLNENPDIGTGTVEEWIASGRESVGKPNLRFERLRNITGLGLANFIHDLSGAAASNPEVARLTKIVPYVSQSTELFKQNAREFIRRARAAGAYQRDLNAGKAMPESDREVSANGKDPLANPF